MEVAFLNVVVLAENYEATVNFYKNAFGFNKVWLEEKTSYNYIELGTEKQLIVAITPAKEMKFKPTAIRNNATQLQLKVKDIHSVFENVKNAGGTIKHGPFMDEGYQILCGAVADNEGNDIWIIEDKDL